MKWFTEEWLGRNKRWSRAHVPRSRQQLEPARAESNHTLKVMSRRRLKGTEAITEFATSVGAFLVQPEAKAPRDGPDDVKGRTRGRPGKRCRGTSPRPRTKASAA